MLGGVADVETHQMALPFDRFGGFVVKPARGADPARRLGGEETAYVAL